MVLPVTWIGAECGVSASSAPNVTMVRQPVSRATSSTVAQNPRQRRFGSGPESSTRSRPSPDPGAAENSNVGHEIRRVTPSTISTSGRLDW